MGTIQTIRPNGNYSGTSAYTLIGGGTTVHGNLSDNSDTTRVQRTVSGDKTAYLNLGTYTLPANNRVKSIRAAARILFNAKPLLCGWGAVTVAGSLFVLTEKIRQSKNSAVQTFYTPWVGGNTAATAADRIMVQSEIDGLLIYIRDKNSSSTNYFYDVWVELDIIDRPTVTVTTPVTTTLRPDVAWTYADGNGDPQTHYEVKIFTAAVYGGGGFNPDTSVAAWESGETASSAGTVRVGTALANSTTHKAYVRVAHDGDLDPYWSAWTASAAFATSITACTTPTMTGVYSEPDGRVELSIVGAAPPGGTTQTLRVERSTDAGVTWTAVRGYTSATFGSPYTPTVYDYEAPLDVTSQYRARAVGVNAGGDDVSSPWSATNSETPWVTGWWLKCPLDSSLNLADVWVLEGPDISVDETIAVFRPIGRDRAVTVAGDLGGQDGSWLIRAGDTDDYQTVDTVAALMTTQNVLYVQDPFGGNRYIRILSRSRTVEGTADFPRTVWSVTYVEVDQPAVE